MRLRYIALLAVIFLFAVWASFQFGAEVDNHAYDEFFRIYRPTLGNTQSIILAIDESTLASIDRGMDGIRRPLARALRLIDRASPKAVVVDVILTDRRSPAADQELADALHDTPNLVLSSLLMDDPPRWEDPRPEFARSAAAEGHVYALPDAGDSVTRAIPLDVHAGPNRRWAIALEAFRVSQGAGIPLESPEDVQVGSVVIPFRKRGDVRLMRIRYLPPDLPTANTVPQVTLKQVLHDPQLATRFKDKVVFVGVTASSEVRDKLFTPYANGRIATGIEIHAEAFETIAQHLFITDVPESWPLLFALLLVGAAGLAFAYLPGWRAYGAAGIVMLTALLTPYVFFTHQRVFSFATPVFSAALGIGASAMWQHLVVRRRMLRAEAERARYQQAMHFVTHEMRTPLSAIQGSSELITRFALSEEKRKQVAQLINSESRRLARMIEIFLNVERLSAGQMDLKREDIPLKPLVELCLERTRPLAERKHIALTLQPIAEDLHLTGDRELMEYACYNLLTNAVKYSPQGTEVTITGWKSDHAIRLAVKDQGIGMDQKEVKKIFQKFYRTKKAEESGEAGTGIGLSIVQQIVEQHGGTIEVVSQPGVGSCFTLVLAV